MSSLRKLNHTQSRSAEMRVEHVTRWIKETWMSRRPETDWIVISANNVCMDESVLHQFDDTNMLEGDYTYSGSYPIQTEKFPIVYNWQNDGGLGQRTGAWVYRFEPPKADVPCVEALVISYYVTDNHHHALLACVPRHFMPTFADFINACMRLRHPRNRVKVVGGNQRNFDPRIQLDDIIMEDDLKQSILDDVDRFFRRGVGIYQKMNLNPFRKILLAGVPGTGKTMLCNALARWALEQDYEVLYISGSDARGANFFKIQQALAIASNARKPTLILLEEIDSYINNKQKSMILNVLDGVESFENEFGTMLIATTNYPEAIDDRVLKRPGRLDRIYIVPPAPNATIVGQMLRTYLGEMWQEEHAQMAKQLVDYPGAFIREVCVFAMTQAIDDGLEPDQVTVPLALLEESFDRLKAQIKARDALIKQNPGGRKFGFAARANSNGNRRS